MCDPVLVIIIIIIIIISSMDIVKKYMPESFKENYPSTRIIIDAAEFQMNQACTFSAYTNRNTIKILIGVTSTPLSISDQKW